MSVDQKRQTTNPLSRQWQRFSHRGVKSKDDWIVGDANDVRQIETQRRWRKLSG